MRAREDSAHQALEVAELTDPTAEVLVRREPDRSGPGVTVALPGGRIVENRADETPVNSKNLERRARLCAEQCSDAQGDRTRKREHR